MDIKTTIEVYSFTLFESKINQNYSFSNDPDIYNHLKKNWASFIDLSSGDIPTEKRAVRIPPKEGDINYFCFDEDKRMIYGILESGLYGKKYDIADKTDPKHNLFSTSKGSAIMKPFFYLIQIPKKGNRGLMILERTENDGVFGVFSSILISLFRDTLSRNFNVKKAGVITNDYLKELSSGVYRSITMSVDSLPKDAAERYFCKELTSEDFSIELTVKFKNARNNQNKIKKIIEGNSKIFLSQDVNEILFGSENKVITTVGKSSKTRTYHLNHENKEMIRPYYEIIVQENENGFGLFKSIYDEVILFIKSNEEFKIFE